MKKKTSILFILTLSFGIGFALILSMRSVLVHSIPPTNDTITNNNNGQAINGTSPVSNTKKPTNAVDSTSTEKAKIGSKNVNNDIGSGNTKKIIGNNNNNNIAAIQKNYNTTAIAAKGLDVSSKTTTTVASKKFNNTFFANGSIASLVIDTRGEESTPSEITSANGSNAIYNATITNANSSNSVAVEGNHTKTYNNNNNNSSSPSEVGSIVNSNIFSRTLGSYNSTSASQNLDDSMINLLTKLIVGSMISGGSHSRYPESITQAASTAQTQTEKPFILTGNWNLSIKKGNVRDFAANFTMLHIDGTGSHNIIKLINFQSDANRTVYLGSDGTAPIMGTVDIELNGTDKWKGVHAIIVIERLNTIYIVLDSNATGNYFKGQPIYGIIGLLKDDDYENGDRL